jgi:type IX secretion system PorP/SprF family membrane protein
MKKILFFFLLCTAGGAFSQQTSMYTQYMLNGMGNNPACSGDNRNYEALMGRRLQWVGFPGAPVTNFVCVSKALYNRPYKTYWHGAGIYIEEDKVGQITDKTIYPIYTFHLVTAKKGLLVFGIAPGIRFFGIGSSLFDRYDPALAAYPLKVTFFPDINAGIRFTFKQWHMDLAVKQIYKNKAVQGDVSVGGPVRFRPHAYFTVSKKILSKSYDYVFEPSIQVRSNFLSFPSVSATCLMYLNKYFGMGLGYRYNDAVSAIVQLKIGTHIVLGLAYDYTVSPLRVNGANSFEMMAGMTPDSFIENFGDTKHGGANCPTWDF